MTFTAIIHRADEGGYWGQVAEMPAALSQGETVDELLENLRDALRLVFDANRESARSGGSGDVVAEVELDP